MKKIIFLIGIVLFSLETYGQIVPLKQIKGSWLSESVCIIATQVPLTTPSKPIENMNEPVIIVSAAGSEDIVPTRWSIDNYHFDINITKFLWIQRYKVRSTNGIVSHVVSKGKYTYDEVNKKFTIRKLRMDTNECNGLNNLNTINYSVIMVNDTLMVWSPDDVQDYTENYLESIRWRR